MRNSLVENNQHRSSVFVGPTGSGKSYAGISTGRILQPKRFSIKRHVALFDAFDFLDKVEDSKPGDVLIFDEAGVAVDAREWNTITNKVLTQVFQTYRTKNLFVIFTTPDFSFIDNRLRKLMHDFVEMKYVDKNRNVGVGKWFLVNVNRWDGNFWRNTLSVNTEKGIREIDPIEFVKPPEKDCKEYERARSKILNVQIEKAREMREGGGRSVTIDQAATFMGANKDQFYHAILKGAFPIDQDSSTLKIPFGYLQKISKEINNSPGDSELSIFHEKDAEGFEKCITLKNGFCAGFLKPFKL